MLDLLWNKYWVNTLSASPLVSNREFAAGQIADISGGGLPGAVLAWRYSYGCRARCLALHAHTWHSGISHACPACTATACHLLGQRAAPHAAPALSQQLAETAGPPSPPLYPTEKLEQVESQLQHGGRMARFASSSDSKKKDGEGALSRVCRWGVGPVAWEISRHSWCWMLRCSCFAAVVFVHVTMPCCC